MLLLNTKIQQLLINKKILTKRMIEHMLQEYYQSVVVSTMDSIQDYIEVNELKEPEKYLKSIVDEIKSKKQSSIADQIKFYTEFFNLVKDYPEMSKQIWDDIDYMNAELDKSIVEALDDDAKLKLIKIIEEDLEEIKQNEKIADQLMASPKFDKA